MSLAHHHEASRETLLRELQANEIRINALKCRNADLEARIAAMAPPEPTRLGKSAESLVRDAIVDMNAFTVPELAAKLQCTPQTARKHIAEWVGDGKLKDTGRRFSGQKIYEYVPPRGPGEGFKTQQRLKPQVQALETVGRGRAHVEGVGGRAPYNEIPAKPVRDAVKWAMGLGWTLSRKGDGHWNLKKGDAKIGVAGTPTNAYGSADIIRRAVRRVEGIQVP